MVLQTNHNIDKELTPRELIIIPMDTVKLYLKYKNFSELISLDSFLRYTINHEDLHVANCLHWEVSKVKKVKKQIDLHHKKHKQGYH